MIEGIEMEDIGIEDIDILEGYCFFVVGINVKVCGVEL